jgi:hypothetical protein
LESPLIYNELHESDCILNPFNHPLELLGFGTFVVEAIETHEHKGNLKLKCGRIVALAKVSRWRNLGAV